MDKSANAFFPRDYCSLYLFIYNNWEMESVMIGCNRVMGKLFKLLSL